MLYPKGPDAKGFYADFVGCCCIAHQADKGFLWSRCKLSLGLRLLQSRSLAVLGRGAFTVGAGIDYGVPAGS